MNSYRNRITFRRNYKLSHEVIFELNYGAYKNMKCTNCIFCRNMYAPLRAMSPTANEGMHWLRCANPTSVFYDRNVSDGTNDTCSDYILKKREDKKPSSPLQSKYSALCANCKFYSLTLRQCQCMTAPFYDSNHGNAGCGCDHFASRFHASCDLKPFTTPRSKRMLLII